MRTLIRDRLMPAHAIGRLGANLSVAHSAMTTIPVDVAALVRGAALTVAGGAVIVLEDGLYLVRATTAWAITTGGSDRTVNAYVNGAMTPESPYMEMRGNDNSFNGSVVAATAVMTLRAADRLTLVGYQSSGAALLATAQAAGGCSLDVSRYA